ncbi:Competence protein ComEA helix-hairpin-helix repeat protein [uncultured Desulfobacterium sp.]|uniref:Competence protein ComEA helix-hairpin-helix repeat protein n=1 Tax=uncultured Desulfobacterium sp. TaxID=201089 RepID=A0A445N3P5_9BACT|nr:Competence protein ComEA helix-hairpin-helix repeat protein [uncultured Desulfobacterium sp.]
MIVVKKWSLMMIALFLVLCFSVPSFSADEGKININTASAEELAKLDKVGEAYAKRIVEYREANGQFSKPEDIMNVKGIGPKIFEANKDRIVVK